MDLGPYTGFIVAAYGVAAIVVVGLTAWVALDHRAQARALADLEAKGMGRPARET
jgi:heme exporter protein D